MIKLVSIGVTVAGMCLGASGITAYWQREQAQHWLRVNTKVVSSSVCSWHTGKGGTAYMPRVLYRYVIGNNVYQSDLVRFGPAVIDKLEAQEIAVKFVTNMQTVAYVDPNALHHAVLDREYVSGAVKWQVGLSVGLIASGVILLVALRDA